MLLQILRQECPYKLPTEREAVTSPEQGSLAKEPKYYALKVHNKPPPRVNYTKQKTHLKWRKHLVFSSPGLGSYSSSQKGQANITHSQSTGGTDKSREEKSITSPFQQQWPADQLSCLWNHNPRPLWPTLLLALNTMSLKPLVKTILHHLRANQNKRTSCLLSRRYIKKDFQLIKLFICKFFLNH